MKTLVAETSIEAYHDLINTGTLNNKQAELIAYMGTVGAVTRRQIAKALDWELGSVAGRVRELIDKKELEEIGTVKCPKTGKTVRLVCLPTGQSEMF
ncbi:MAG: hypothetical protein V3T32_00505 [Thermodesulfobacteriota bacterium]